MKIVFAGAPEFAAEHLRAILASQHDVIAVYTQPDRPAGRGRKLQPTAVKQVALDHDIEVYQPVSLKTEEDQQVLRDLAPDLMVVVAYGLILPEAVLKIPRYGCINVHASLLPRWRGAAPIQRAITEGDAETGVTIMQMDKGLDTGDMLLRVSCPVTAEDTAALLHDRLIELGRPALLDVLGLIEEGHADAVPQDPSLATYAEKLSKDEAQIDWSLSADRICRLVQGFNPWPVAFTHLEDKVIRIWNATADGIAEGSAEPGTIVAVGKSSFSVQCGTGVLVVHQLQLPGARSMTAGQVLNGHRDLFSEGRVLGL